MPRLELRPMRQPSHGACIGTLDNEPITLVGREYHVGGRVLTQRDVGDALVDAVDAAATRVLGSEWVTSLARLMLVNRRTTSKDRISKSGLPEYVLLLLAKAAASPHPRAVGHALLCVIELQDAYTTASHASGRPAAVDTEARNQAAAAALQRALSVVDDVLAEREEFRRRKEGTESGIVYESGGPL